MSYIEDIQNRRNQVRNNIAKGFGCEFVKAQDDEFGEIEKAVYADTPQNRKLGRVGQEYHRGRKKQNIEDNQQKNRKEEGSNNLKQGNSAKTKSSKSKSSASSITTVDDAATFLQKNVDKWSDYQYEELDDEKLEKQFDEANKYIKDFRQFDWKETDEANAYKEKMEKKGYKIVDLGEGSDTYIFAVLKKSNKK